MKRTLLILALCLVPIIAGAQEQSKGITGVLAGSAWTGDKGDTWDGGLKIGTEFLADEARHLSLRTLYCRLNSVEAGEKAQQTVEVSALIAWYIGHKWSLYTNSGASVGLSSEGGVEPIMGIGFARKIWEESGKQLPAQARVFFEFHLGDGIEISEYAQINVGLSFTKSGE